MKNIVAIFALAVASAAFADESSIISVTASLKDGSTVRGELAEETIAGSTIFMEKLALDPAIVKSVNFSGANGESKVELVNGDKFAMTVANESFAVKSLLGDLKIPRGTFRSLALAQRKVAAGGVDEGLVFHCTFDDEAAITAPVAGPKGRFLQGTFQDGKVGKSLQTTVYEQNAVFDLPANFFGTSGCIEFWAKILNPSAYIGNGGDPRLFTITQKSTNKTICTLDIVSNNGGGNSGFSTWTILGNMASQRGCRSLRYEDLFPSGNCRDWHHFAVVWDKDGIADLPGSPKMALLVDGKYVRDIQGHTRSAEDAMAIISTPMRLSFTHDPDLGPEHSTKSPFLIDEFKIWDHAKTNFDIIQ